MTNYGAWGTATNIASSGPALLAQILGAKRQREMNEQNDRLKEAQIQNAESQAKESAFGSSSSLGGNTGQFPNMFPNAPKNQGAEIQGPTMPGQDLGKVPIQGLDNKTTIAMAERTNASRDALNMQKMQLDLMKANNPNGAGMGRGQAAIFNKYFTTQDSNRLSSVDNAVNLHNALVDLHQAYWDMKGGDVNKALTVLQSKAANNDYLRSYIGSIGNDPENIVPIYNQARRMAGGELFKLTTGTTAMPTEDAIHENMKNYADLSMNPEQAQPLFNLATDTQIMPAITNLKGKVILNRNKQTGQFSVPELGSLYQNLEDKSAETLKRTRRLRGTSDSIVPDGKGWVPKDQNQNSGFHTDPDGTIIIH